MTTKPYHDMSNTRLEIGTAPAGLPNLVENPSGALGAWFWVTPVGNTLMTSTGSVLKFTTTVSQAAYWVSDFMKVAATRYVAARFDTVTGSAAHTVRVRYEWYDSNKALLSSSAQTAAISNAAQTNYVAAIQAPASTAYVKIRFDLYNGTGTTNPATNANYQFKNAMVTWATTNAFATVRTNLVTNPSFETNTTGWGIGSNAGSAPSFTRSNTFAATGSWSGALAAGAATSAMGITSGQIAITGGKDYTFIARARAGSAGRQVAMTITWLTSGGGFLGTKQVLSADVTGSFTVMSASDTAPAGAAKALLTLDVLTPGGGNFPSGEIHYFDGLFLEQATSAGTYFDGSFAASGSFTYAWTGTANASTSTQTNTSFAFVEPTNWQNILGPTHAIDIVRSQMDPGTLTAEILDAALDPAVVGTIKPGVKVRLVTNTTGTWDNVFEGKTSRGTTAYVLDKRPGGKVATRITLTATDNVGAAANKPETRGMADIDSLPFIFEGKGIPWNCNGSGNQITSPAIVSGQPLTTLLDQIGFARDSTMAWCWVDRFNVFQCWDKDMAPSANVATFSDTGTGLSYSDIDVGYDTDSVINSVTIKFLRFVGSTGDTTEVPYGPYIDQSAIDANNGVVVNREFTIQAGFEVPLQIQNLALGILDANSTPQMTCRTLRMPVRNAAEMAAATTIDLYGKVTVTFGTKFNDFVRVTGIKHSITPDKWTVDYEFEGILRIAPPRPRRLAISNSTNDDPTDGTWITPVMGNSWVNAGGTERPVQYMRKNGVVYIEGRGKSGTLGATAFALPVGFRPSATLRFPSDGNNVYAQLAITAAGAVIQATGSNAGFSFNCSFVAEG